MTPIPMIMNAMIEKYIADRGGHDSKCCFFNQGYGCNCRAGEWGDPFRAGFNLAMHSASQPADCRKCGGTRLVQENSGRPVPCDLCPSQPADEHARSARPVGDDELVARLRRRHTCNMSGKISVHHLKNPDGPEAADRITDLQTGLERYRGLVHESLFHLRLDDRARDYHNRALEALSDGEG